MQMPKSQSSCRSPGQGQVRGHGTGDTLSQNALPRDSAPTSHCRKHGNLALSFATFMHVLQHRGKLKRLRGHKGMETNDPSPDKQAFFVRAPDLDMFPGSVLGQWQLPLVSWARGLSPKLVLCRLLFATIKQFRSRDDDIACCKRLCGGSFKATHQVPQGPGFGGMWRSLELL